MNIKGDVMATKQKSGLYRTKIKIGVDANGKDVVKWISGKTKKELEDARREVIAHYIEGQANVSDRLFGEYAVEWFKTIKAPELSPSSLESYKTALNRDILPEFGERTLRAISATEVQQLVNRFAGMSATKIAVICATLQGIFESACADQVLQNNPMTHIRKPKATPPAEKHPLTNDERRKIEAVCAERTDALYLALMYYMGLRPGEARGLQWGDIDWAAGSVHIQRDIDYKDHGRVGSVKTRKSNRVIPLPDSLRAILGNVRGLPDRFIVCGCKGGILAKTSAERLWVELMKACDMVKPVETDTSYRPTDIRSKWEPIITPHAIRHNYATMCWENGIDPYTTMRLMGHSSIKTTMDIYTHLNDAQFQKMAEKIEGVFENKVAQKLHKASGTESYKK